MIAPMNSFYILTLRKRGSVLVLAIRLDHGTCISIRLGRWYLYLCSDDSQAKACLTWNKKAHQHNIRQFKDTLQRTNLVR